MFVVESQEEPPANADKPVREVPTRLTMIGEGGESGDIIPGKSVVFATLEVCLCVLVRQLPGLNPSLPSTGFAPSRTLLRPTPESTQLVSLALQIIVDLPPLCSPKGTAQQLIVCTCLWIP